MLNLLKNDLLRTVKDKLFLIACIIAGAFALVNPLLYKVLFSSLELESGGLIGTVNAKSLFFSAFMPGDNMGLILPVLIAIVICKDYSQGTVRNKIISGKARRDIFLSTYISCFIILWAVIFIHALVTMLISLVFFEYHDGGFTWADFGYLMASIGLEIAVYAFIAALLTFFCVCMKNAGLAVVCYVAITFLFALIGGIITMSLMMITPEHSAYELLIFLSKANIFSSSVIGGGSSYSFKEILYVLLPSIVGTALFLVLGGITFKNKDLK